MARLLLLAALSGVVCLAANVTGRWDITAKSENGQEIKAYLVLQSEGNRLTGTIGTEEGEVPISDATFSDPDLSFKIETDQTSYAVKATVTGDLMKGKYTASTEGSSGTFTAVRVNSGGAAPGAQRQ
jgi:hypothetical protein